MPSSPPTPTNPRPAPPPCAPASIRLAVLPSGPKPPARPSFGKTRTGRRRAMVLGLLYAAFLVHLLHWFWKGRTLSPVEPSETMYTLETGAVNAGAIFFALALLSTIVFGRFFCGWGCHVVALQDLCAWSLSKIGVRPRPFRSRLLVWVPLFFACYMFLWPTLKREAIQPALEALARGGSITPEGHARALAFIGVVGPFPGFRSELIVPDFWATFAGPVMAVPFLFICGFACVYFLGAKGFCTYGCPYGGFFYHVERLSPARIVVDHDKCEGCGHCTATCTSNVRVHEEIRDFGMVVDPGCMKCMDCIAVCPKEALSLKFDRPGVLKTRKRGRATSTPGVVKPAAGAPAYDLSWPGEIALAILFTITFVAFRGLYGAVPLLMAIGVAACVSFVLWKGARLLSSRNVTLHNFQLRLKGRLKTAGAAFALLALLTLALLAHSATVRGLARFADRFDSKVLVGSDQVFTPQRPPVPAEQQSAAKQAVRYYTLASSWRIGGIGLASTPEVDVRLAWLHSVLGDWKGAEAALRRIVARGQLKENLAENMAQILALQGRPADAEDFLRTALRDHPRFDGVRSSLIARLLEAGRTSEGETLAREGVAQSPKNARARFQLGLILLSQGKNDEGLEALRAAVDLDPKFAPSRQQYAIALFSAGKGDEALAEMTKAHDLAPDDPIPAIQMAQMLVKLGRTSQATPWLDLADKLTAAQKAKQNAPTNRP